MQKLIILSTLSLSLICLVSATHDGYLFNILKKYFDIKWIFLVMERVEGVGPDPLVSWRDLTVAGKMIFSDVEFCSIDVLFNNL